MTGEFRFVERKPVNVCRHLRDVNRLNRGYGDKTKKDLLLRSTVVLGDLLVRDPVTCKSV